MMPGLPRMPRMDDAMQLFKAQAEILAELPSTVIELQRTARELTETLVAMREAVAAAQRVANRVEGVLDDMEEPVRQMRPGIARLAAVLDDPAIDRIPSTLRAIELMVEPVAAGLTRLRDRSARVVQQGRQLSRRLGSVGGQ
jgi:ABC-type transporter Mla subunit MlaD